LLEEALRGEQVRSLVKRLRPGPPLLRPEAGDLRDDPLREGLDLPAAGPQVRVLHQGLHRGPEVERLPPAEPGELRDRPPHPCGSGVQDDPCRPEGRHLQDLPHVVDRRPEVPLRGLRGGIDRVFCRAVANRTQSWRRTPMDSTKSWSKLGSSRPSPAFASPMRTRSAPNAFRASRRYQTFPFDFDIFLPPRARWPTIPNARG